MHQRLQGSGHEPVDDEDVLFDIECWVAAFKVPGMIIRDSMTQDQILSARRRPDWIGLHETHALERAFQRNGLAEVSRDGKAPQVIESDQHRQMLFKVRNVIQSL